MWLKFLLCAVFMIIALISDIREYKIKNKYVLCLLIIGLVINTVQNGFDGFLFSMAGLAVPLVLLPLFALRMLGAGDIKAFCAMGAVLGSNMIINIMIYSFIASGIAAFVLALARKNFAESFKSLWRYFKQCFFMRKIEKYEAYTDQKNIFRFSIGMFIGFIILIADFYFFNGGFKIWI